MLSSNNGNQGNLTQKCLVPPSEISPHDREVLRSAVRALEASSLTEQLSKIAGRPLKLLGGALPQVAGEVVSRAAEVALRRALRIALQTISMESVDPKTGFHKALSGASGAIGGAFGFLGVLIELPISTTIILRSIAAIAQSEGEDLRDPETSLACIQVFALGGSRKSRQLHESSYFAARAALAHAMAGAVQQLAERELVEESAAALGRLLSQIASRFAVVTSERVAALGLPLLGAIGGAVVNAAFTSHFQTLARGHFAVRRLSRIYGKTAVRLAYEEIRAAEGL